MQHSVLYGQVFLMMALTSRTFGDTPFSTKYGSRAGKYFPKKFVLLPTKATTA